MKNNRHDTAQLVALFAAWCKRVGSTFPHLWEAARLFAPLVVEFCGSCGKPKTVTFVPVGDHAECQHDARGNGGVPFNPPS